MATFNNPAGHLHQLLVNLKNMERGGQPQTVPAFAAVLNTSTNDTIVLIQRIARMAALVQRTKERVLAIKDEDTAIYLEWLVPIQTAFSALSLSGALSSFTERYDAVALERLRFCAHMLSRRASEPELVAEELAKVQKEVDELIKEIKESETDAFLKEYMLRHLNSISDAIREYNLFGSDRIREEVSTAIGSAFFYPKQAKQPRKEYWEVVSHVADLAQIVASAVVIGEAFVKFLPS
jgi:hypothetical protein